MPEGKKIVHVKWIEIHERDFVVPARIAKYISTPFDDDLYSILNGQIGTDSPGADYEPKEREIRDFYIK